MADPYKQKEYETYCLWKSIPAFAKEKVIEQLMKKHKGLGFDDEAMLELCQITTKTEFSEKYGVDMDTLKRWDDRVENEDIMKYVRKWAQKLTKNVLFGVYNQAIQKGGMNAELWLKFVESWSPKASVSHDIHGTLAELMSKATHGGTTGEKDTN